MSRKRIKPIYDCIPGYTLKQSQFLRGELSVDEIDGHFLWRLRDQVKSQGNTELLPSIEALIKLKKQEAEKRRKEKMKAILNGEDIPLEQVNRNYTRKEAEIINGVMEGSVNPNEIHGNTLRLISAKAKGSGDVKVHDVFYALYNERQSENAKKFARLKQKDKNADESGETPEDYLDRTELTAWEKSVLECKEELSGCALIHLEHICNVIEKNPKYKKYAEVAPAMLKHKKNPMSVCEELDMDAILAFYHDFLKQ